MQLTVALDGARGTCARGRTSPEKSPALEDSRKRLCPPPIHVCGQRHASALGPSSAPKFQRAPGHPPLLAWPAARAFAWGSVSLRPEGLFPEAGPHHGGCGIGGLCGT